MPRPRCPGKRAHTAAAQRVTAAEWAIWPFVWNTLDARLDCYAPPSTSVICNPPRCRAGRDEKRL